MTSPRDESRVGAYLRLRYATMLSGAGAAALAGAVTGWAAAATAVAPLPAATAPAPVAPLTPEQLMSLEFSLPTPPPKQVVIVRVPAQAGRQPTGLAQPRAVAARPAALAPAAAPPRPVAVAPAAAAPAPAATTGTS